MTTFSVDQNHTECIVRTTDLGSITVTNVCAGTVHTIHWGSVDYMYFVLSVSATLIIATLFINLIMSIPKVFR